VKEQVDDVGDLLKVGKDEGLVFVLKLASRLAASSGPFCLSVSRRTRCCSGNSHSRWREVLVLRFTLRCIPHTALSASCVSSLRSGLRLRLRLRLRSSISETDTEPVCATPVHLLVDAEPRATDQVFSK
jgi:hypothetical protein